MSKTKILIAEDHKIVREGIVSLLKDERDFTILSDASNGQELLDLLSTNADTDLVLMDVNMPVLDGLDTTKIVRKKFPHVKILLLSMLDIEKYVIKGFEAGAHGYALKDIGKEELTLAIKKILNGDVYISSTIAYNIISTIKDNNHTSAENSIDLSSMEFSSREMEILKLIADGYTNNEIADKIFVSRRTVELHRKNLLDKTNSKNTAMLIRCVIEQKLIK